MVFQYKYRIISSTGFDPNFRSTLQRKLASSDNYTFYNTVQKNTLCSRMSSAETEASHLIPERIPATSLLLYNCFTLIKTTDTNEGVAGPGEAMVMQCTCHVDSSSSSEQPPESFHMPLCTWPAIPDAVLASLPRRGRSTLEANAALQREANAALTALQREANTANSALQRVINTRGQRCPTEGGHHCTAKGDQH